MYQNPVGPVATVAGVAVLPNTGGNELLLVAAAVTIVLGVAITASTAVRLIAQKANKA